MKDWIVDYLGQIYSKKLLSDNRMKQVAGQAIDNHIKQQMKPSISLQALEALYKQMLIDIYEP